MMVVCLYFVLLLGIVGETTAQDFSGGPEGSRIVLLTNILTSPTDVEKLCSALVGTGLTNIDLIVPQRASPHSPPVLFSVLSKGKNRTVWQGTINELIAWLSVEKPNTLISVTDNTDVPQVLASARKKGLLSVTRLVIWITKSDASDTNGRNGITLTSPADFDSQTNTFGARRTMQFTYYNNIQSVLVHMLQTEKYNVHKRGRRALQNVTPVSSSPPTTSADTSSSVLAFSVSPSISVAQATTQRLSSSMAGTSSVIVVPPGGVTPVSSSLPTTSADISAVLAFSTSPCMSVAPGNSSPSSSMAGASSAVVEPSASPSALSIKAPTSSEVEATPSSSSSSLSTVLVTSTAAVAPSASLSPLSVNAGTASALGASPDNTSPSSLMVATSTAAVAPPATLSSSSVNAGTSSALVASTGNTSPSSAVVATSTAAVAPPATLSSSSVNAGTSSALVASTGNTSPSSAVVATSTAVISSPTSLSSSSVNAGTSSSLVASPDNTSQSSSMVAISTAAVAPPTSLSTASIMAATSSVAASLTSSPSSTSDATTSSAAVPAPSLTSQPSALTTSPSESIEADTSSTLIASSYSPSLSSIIVGTSSESVASITSPSSSITIAGPSSAMMATARSLATSSIVAGTSSSLAVPPTSSLPSSTMVSSSTAVVPSPGSSSPSSAVVSAFSVTTAPPTSVSPSSVEVGTTFVSVGPLTSSSPSVVAVVTSSSLVAPASGSAISSAAVTASSSFLSVPVGSSSVSSVKVISSFKYVSVLPTSTKIASRSASEFVPGVTIVNSVTSASSQPGVQSTSESLYFSPIASMSLTFSERATIVSTSKPSTVSPSPRNSSFSSYSNSMQIGPTSLTLAFTVVTSEPSSLSTSVITPSSTEGQPSPTSEAVTEPSPVYKKKTMRIELKDGNCKEILDNPGKKQEFEKQFIREVAIKLLIDQSYVSVDSIECGSIVVIFTVAGASGKPNVSHVLKEYVNRGNFTVKVGDQTFTAYKIELVLTTSTSSQAPTTKAPRNRITLILYITFGGVMGLIFIAGIIVIVVRCRRDRHEGSFFLSHGSNYELRRFQGIPRASNYSKMNYYGDPVELDATAADPNAPDEFQAQEGGYPYNQSRSLDRGQAIATSNNDDKFNVDTMGLPEWKNLPKLSKSEVAVAGEPKQDILKTSGSIGSRQHLLDGDNSQKDGQRAYDNPTITFSSGAYGFDEEEDSYHAHDNPAVTVEDALPAPEKEVS